MITSKSLNQYLIPGLIVLIHLVLKLYTAPSMNIWGDEAFSIFYSQQDILDLNKMLVNELNPPLYFYLLHYWIELFGIGVLAVKSLSILFSAISGLMIYKIGRLIQGNQTALLASAFFLFSNLHFDFSHEVRAYSLVCLEVLLSFYFFILYIKKRKHKCLIALMFVNVCIAYTHYIAILIPCIQFIIIWLFLPKKKEVLWIFATYLSSGILFLPYLFIMLGTVPDEDFWLKSPNFGFLEYVVLKLVGNDVYNKFLLFPFAFSPVFFIPKLREYLFRDGFNAKDFTLFYVWFFAPILIDYMVAQYVPVFRLRYLLSSSLGLYLGLSYLIYHIRLPNYLTYVIMSLYFISFIQVFKPENRCGERWDKTARLLSSHEGTKAVTLISAGYKLIDLTYYYDREIFQDYRKLDPRMKERGVFPLSKASDLTSVGDINDFDNVNLILSHSIITDPEHSLENYFNNENYNLCDDFRSRENPRFMVFSKKGLECNDLSLEHKEEIDIDCTIWEKSHFKDLHTMASMTSFKLKMTLPMDCSNHEFINETTPSFVVYDKSQYSPGLHLTCDNYFKIAINAKTRGSKTEDAVFVYAHFDNEEMLEYDSFPSSAEVFNTNSSELSYSYLPDHDHLEGCYLKIFMWNPSENKVFLEDLEIELWK